MIFQNKWLLRSLLILIVVIFSFAVFLYVSIFWGGMSKATTQDFANFGTYLGGVTLPISIIISAMTVGYQLRKSAEISKQERLCREFNELLNRLVISISGFEPEFIEKIEMKAREKYIEDKAWFVDDVKDFYLKNISFLELVGLTKSTLEQIESIDSYQSHSLRIKVFTLVNRDLFSSIERLRFYLDTIRFHSNLHDYFWVCGLSEVILNKKIRQ